MSDKPLSLLDLAVSDTGTDLYAVHNGNSRRTPARRIIDLASYANVSSTGSTTPRTLAARFAEVVNVKDYGALGDGATDDTAAIVLAVAALPSSGGGLYFPPGVYIISSAISLGTKGRITVFGHASKSIIFLAANSNSDMFTWGDGSTFLDYPTFDGVWLDGNRANQSGGTGSCINFNGAEFPTVRNCIVVNGKLYNIKFDTTGSQFASFPRVINSVVQSAGAHNIYLGAGAFGSIIANNVIRTSGRATAGSAGVYANNNSEITITNNDFDENSIHVRLFSAESTTITGNFMLSADRHGIQCENDCTQIAIVGNTIRNSSLETNNTYSGVVLTGTDCTVSGNVIGSLTATMLNGILESGSPDRNVISGNSVSGATTKITRVGSATILIGNAGVDDVLGPHQINRDSTDVNGLQLLGVATANSPALAAIGSDSNIGINLTTKGAANYQFQAGAFARTLFQMWDATSAVNWLRATAAAAGTAPDLSAQGNDTNINVKIVPKGTGSLELNAPLNISGAAGGQIAFPASQNASSNANTLDDYEEGTWTPVLTFATPGNLSVSYSVQTGFYTKIGQEVILHGTIFTSAFTHSSASGNVNITGLPFTAASTRAFGAMRWQGITKASYTDMITHISIGATLAEVFGNGSGQAVSAVTTADMPTGGTVQLGFCVAYMT